MPVPLHRFAQQQVDVQGLTVKEFAKRSGLGLSHAYQILRGERQNATPDTFEAVARGLSMTPAEMLVAMGKGASADDPEEVEWLALMRQVPAEKLPAAKDMLRGLAVQPSQRSKSQAAGVAKRLEQRRRELLTGVEQDDQTARKRRQFAIRGLSTVPEAALRMALAALGLNRDSGRAPATA